MLLAGKQLLQQIQPITTSTPTEIIVLLFVLVPVVLLF